MIFKRRINIQNILGIATNNFLDELSHLGETKFGYYLVKYSDEEGVRPQRDILNFLRVAHNNHIAGIYIYDDYWLGKSITECDIWIDLRTGNNDFQEDRND